MNEAATCRYSHLDAAYVLGALSGEERLEFERHLPGCRSCSRAVQQLAGLPGLLAQVSPDVLEAGRVEEPVPDTLLPALVQEVRRTQHRRRWTVALAAAAAVVVLGAGTVAVMATTGDTSPPPTSGPSISVAHEMAQVDQTSVLGQVALTSVAWGTRIDLTCSYNEPDGGYQGESPHTYALVVHTRDGGTEQVATWKGLPGKTMHLTGATALTADQIQSVEVRTADGQPVLELMS
jgi:hypothetical protein